MLRTTATICAVAISLALPGAALSKYGPAGGTETAVSGTPVNYLYDAKYAPAQTAGTRTAAIVRIVRPAGFDYGDAGIGAATAVLVVALGAALLLVRAGRVPRASGTPAH